MIGLILGDIAGSRFEKKTPPVKYDFELLHEKCNFTDDTVLSIAIADAILNGKSYEMAVREYYGKYPDAGYGSSFKAWANDPISVAYDSFGNGSAMRSSPVGWAYNTNDMVIEESTKTAIFSHNHPEGILGANAVALAVYMARKKCDKNAIRNKIIEIGYPEIADVNGSYCGFDVTCRGTVPKAIWAFLESSSTEDAIRKAIMIGGDADTLASIAGSIAFAYYDDLQNGIVDVVLGKLPCELVTVVEKFMCKYG